MSSAAIQARELLENAFPGRITTPDSKKSFETERERPWSQSCWLPAAAYVVLSTTREVVSALAVVRKTGCKFAIRTSGHNPNVGFSSVDGSGVVLDLRGLKGRTLGDNNVLHAGGGCVWGDIYPFLEEHGRSPIGGRETQVGLGGFLTGGGYPAFSSFYGIGPDSVKGCEVVVLADGSIFEANAHNHAELWRALKGGTSNFAIVTRFDIEVHPLIKAKFIIKLYDPSDFANINAATISVQEAIEKDPKLNLFTNCNKQFVAVIMIYADSPAGFPKAFQPFDKLSSHLNTVVPPTDGTVFTVVKTLSTMGHVAQSLSRKIGCVTTKISVDLYDEVNKCWQEAIKKVPEGGTLHYTVQPVATAAVQAGKDRGAEKIAKDKDLHLDFICPSFAGAKQNVLRGFGQKNLQDLKEVAAKYDPEGVFQKQQSGGFLLRDA
ncbi:hypothetical protein INS49_000757 [Diaporthe citri]|uniref:uncharacterized protein n=1 Tax=Diaporthe citri TaxID=83186 RepID=UPI001C807D07|nr:uncharacterized protein INS49_000757 [Diaporthe citri]KAG6366579.1 hypothetical protein INS49_000757 [Diaporthe citri]